MEHFAEMIQLTTEGRMALAMNDFLKAREILTRKHALVIKTFGEKSVYAATSGVDLGEALLNCGDYEKAIEILESSASIYEQAEIKDDRVIRLKSALSMALYKSADYEAAETAYFDLFEELKSLGPEYELMLAQERDHLAQAYLRQLRLKEAEKLLVESLIVFEKRVPDSNETGVCLSFLSKVYFLTERYREAEALSRKALSIFKQLWGEDSTRVGICMDELAMKLAMRAQSESKKELAAEAVSLGEKAIEILNKTLPQSHPSIHAVHQNLKKYRHMHNTIGLMYPSDIDEEEDSAKLPKEAVNHPNHHPDSIKNMISKAWKLVMDRDYEKAYDQLNLAKSIALETFGEDSSITNNIYLEKVKALRRNCSFLLGEPTGKLMPAESMAMQMRAHAIRGEATDHDSALPEIPNEYHIRLIELLKEALAIVNRFIPSGVDYDTFLIEEKIKTLLSLSFDVGDILEILSYAQRAKIIRPEEACEKANLIIQIKEANHLAIMIDRGGMITTNLELNEKYRDLKIQYETQRELWIDSIIDKTDASVKNKVKQVEDLRLELEKLRKEIGDHQQGTENNIYAKPIAINEIQKQLDHDEALVAYSLGRRAIFILLISPNDVRLVRVEYEFDLLVTLCNRFKESLTFNEEEDMLPEFDLPSSRVLYELLCMPLEKHLQEFNKLSIVPDGPLWSISFKALFRNIIDAAEEALLETKGSTDSLEILEEKAEQNPLVRRVNNFKCLEILSKHEQPNTIIARVGGWLGNAYSISVLPAQQLISHREDIVLQDSNKPFIGFGNPTFGDDSKWEPLPQTERLLDQLAQVMEVDIETEVYVRDSANLEHIIKLNTSGALAKYQVICFATHSIYATSDEDILQESGLVLAANETKDFTVLSTSLIRQLKLNADLVMLTACNTIAPSGKQINSPLSGLANSFFTAGARNLLVSLWPIDAFATELIIQKMFDFLKKGDNIISALKYAEEVLQNNKENPQYAHPIFWSGFSIIGNGTMIFK